MDFSLLILLQTTALRPGSLVTEEHGFCEHRDGELGHCPGKLGVETVKTVSVFKRFLVAGVFSRPYELYVYYEMEKMKLARSLGL